MIGMAQVSEDNTLFVVPFFQDICAEQFSGGYCLPEMVITSSFLFPLSTASANAIKGVVPPLNRLVKNPINRDSSTHNTLSKP